VTPLLAALLQFGVKRIRGRAKAYGKKKLAEKEREQVAQTWEHMRRKHPEWFTPEGSFHVRADEQDETPLVGFLNAMTCAVKHGKCKHKP